MKIFSHYKTDGLMWFRIFGIGLVIKDMTRHPLIFSERNGCHKMIIVGKWVIRYLNYLKP